MELELELDRLDARAGAAVREYLAARWRERDREIHRSPPLPAVLDDAAALARLDRWRAASRRAELWWRWFATARVENDPAVAAAVRAGDAEGAARARDAAARAAGWGDYAAHVRQRDELPEGRPSFEKHRPAWASGSRGLAALTPDAAAAELLQRCAALGSSLAGVQLDVALDAAPDAPVRARTFPVDAPDDVRVYVRAPHAPRGWRALAHELGHALYARGHDPDLPWSLRAAPSRAAHEAVAGLLEWIAGGPVAYPGASATTQLYDPGAEASYEYAEALTAALARAGDGLAPGDVGPWLAEHVFWPGAAITTDHFPFSIF